MTMTDNEHSAILAEWPYRLGPDEDPNVYVRTRADRVTAAVCAYFEMTPAQVGNQYAKRDALEAQAYLVYLLGVGHPDPALAWEEGLIPEGHARLLSEDIGRYLGLKPGILRMALERVVKIKEEEPVTFRMTVQELREDIARCERDELRRVIAGEGPQAQQHLATMDLRRTYFAKVERARVPRFSGADRMEEARQGERDAFRQRIRTPERSVADAHAMQSGDSSPRPPHTVADRAPETLEIQAIPAPPPVMASPAVTPPTSPATPADALVFPRTFAPLHGAQVTLLNLGELEAVDAPSPAETRATGKKPTGGASRTHLHQIPLLEGAHG